MMPVLMSVGELLGHVFLPRRSNNQRPRILHPAGLSVLVAVFLLNFSLRTLITYLPGFILGFSSSVTIDEVVNLTNQERAKAGLTPLTIDPLLTQAAQSKATDMLSFNYWAHISPTGTQPWKFIQDTGYTYRYAGENLGRDFSNTSSLVKAWMASPTHRENILNNKYLNIGVAVVDGNLGGVETRLVVQLFATPTPAPLAQTQPQPSTPISLVEEAPALEEIPFLTEGAKLKEPKPQFIGTTIAQAVTERTPEARLVSPTEITQAFGMILVALILGTLIVDWVIAHRRKTVRLVGKNWAHMMFMAVIALMMLQYVQGRIL